MSIIKRLRVLVAALVVVCAAGICALPEVANAQSPAATAESAGTPVAPPAPSSKATEVVENPYGLDALWKTGDFVAKGTLMILVIMSMGTWYILVVKVVEQSKLFRQYKAAKKTFWSAGSLQDGANSLAEGNAFRFIAERALGAGQHHEGSQLDQIDLNTWITMQVQRAVENVQNRLQDGLAFLATVGSTAPFVGLFGTVWGIYHALTAIGIAGQASIDKVAGPVGEALIMTAIGLAVAVPAVLGYNWLVRRNKVAMENVRAFSGELHMVMISKQSRKG
ncbi:MAG: MotA/TolQ/ExbB proton channel family protein [Rhodocyclaceae bacterium]|jgi:biopolymer transport protein ExbB|nr:MotA/TolQ/ExbB proton channel family protein [Rhodocyclaceae bacterium]MBK6552437.1 MotA/TolQ/ExbB proton channel family protein [Rhodocyclaceae bacterium]MBK9311973.1 MotA/TolQ/ExbB proton channel family protein [Rhodocyclaceae bacterium]